MSTNSTPGISRMHRHLYYLLTELIKKIQLLDFPYMPDVIKIPLPVLQPARKRIYFPNNKKIPNPVQKDLRNRF